MSAIEDELAALRIDPDNLYRQESYSDLGPATLQVFRPVTAEGADDSARPTRYIGVAQLMTAHGAIPVQAEIEAANLSEAARKLPDAVEKTIQDLVARAQEFERERAGGIVVPPPGSRITLP